MKKLLLLTFLYLSLISTTYGQSVSKTDSLKVMAAVNKVFLSVENTDFSQFKKIATTKLYCYTCEGAADSKLGPYVVSRNDFMKHYLPAIKSSEYWQRAKQSDEVVLVQENKSRSDITVFITTWKEGEYAIGHEGAQLGLYFKKVNGKFRFSGMETIP
jgi:hypothetical protein